MRTIAAMAVCVFVGTAVYAEPQKAKKAQKKQPQSSPVIELDPWGRPPQSPGEHMLIWQDENGWHIRSYAGGKARASYAGTIQIVNGKVNKLWGTQGLESTGKKGSDLGQVSKDGKSISFQFKMTKGGEDGFDFSTTSTTTSIEVAMRVDGYDHPEKIRIGASGQQASGMTFSLPATK